MDIQFEGIRKSYGKQLIVSIDNLYLKGNRIYCLMGKNGVGKTTLLRIIAGLDKDYSGKIMLCSNGTPVKDVRKHVTMVFQSPYMLNMSIWDNIAYGLKVRGISKKEIRKRVNECLEMLDLADISTRNALKISAGQAQRVALARAVAFKPSVLLLDEPTSSADDDNKKLMTDIIKRANNSDNTTVIVVTHDMEQARILSGNILTMREGRILM
jgi:tungstate transport system ATP-binding protein